MVGNLGLLFCNTQELNHIICQGPSHGGSYMDKGVSYIRIGLLPHIVTGDCLASASYSMPPSFVHSCMSDV